MKQPRANSSILQEGDQNKYATNKTTQSKQSINDIKQRENYADATTLTVILK